MPILVAANYLLLAIFTLVAGATGDKMGRKRVLEIGLAAVLFAELASMFWLGTDGFLYADVLLNIAQVVITPMCVALAAVSVLPAIRPFAFGAIFTTQGIAIGLSSTFYSVLKSLGNGTIVFFLPITLGVIAFWLILRQVQEGAARQYPGRFVNLVWAGAVFIAVYGLSTHVRAVGRARMHS